MSSKSTKEPEHGQLYSENTADFPLGKTLSEIVIPYSSLLPPHSETVESKRNLVHLALLKIEFEQACRDFWKEK